MIAVVNHESKKIHPMPAREECNLDDADKDNIDDLTTWEDVRALLIGNLNYTFCEHHDAGDD